MSEIITANGMARTHSEKDVLDAAVQEKTILRWHMQMIDDDVGSRCRVLHPGGMNMLR